MGVLPCDVFLTQRPVVWADHLELFESNVKSLTLPSLVRPVLWVSFRGLKALTT